MIQKIFSFITLFVMLVFGDVHGQPDGPLKLWYNRPADNWNEALPLGNGRLGAMVFGVPEKEHLQLNEETIWAGQPNSNANPDALDALPEVRKLIFEGKYFEAQTLATEKIMSKASHGSPYQPMGDLYISFPGHGNYSNFYRDLDLENAFATVTYEANDVHYKREIFTSFTDQVIVVRLTADKPRSITCNVSLSTPHEEYSLTSSNGILNLNGITESHEGVTGAVKFQTFVKAKTEGGTSTDKDGQLFIDNADAATLYISIATNFKNYKELTVDQVAKAQNFLDNALKKKYDKALADHEAFYKKYFDRVKLDLGRTDSVHNPTDIRIKQFANGFDPQLATTYFQFGRYLLICSSQPGGQPPTLQGIWNDKLKPSWDCKYTTNINLEMNYWPVEVTNLSEMHEPMVSLVSDLAVTGHQTAKIMYNCNGWVLHHNTDIWRITGPVDKATSGMWPSGGAWLCQDLWERYEYTGSKEYLALIYPLLKGSAQFFLDYMIEEPEHHWLVVCPSNSPEHAHAGSEPKATIACGCTMDNQLVFDLFSNIIRASEILNTDKSFADTLRKTRERLAPVQIGQYSQLQEWIYDWDDPNDTHRHVSHLYGVYPSNEISPYRTPELFDAARTSLIYRGDASTGWSMGWKVCLWARFLDGNHAYKLLSDQLNLVTPEQKKGGGTYANMFDAHPPFQIDGNFGCTAGFAEMFMQSYDGFINILPALPDVWKNGSISGLVARGGFVLNISWKDGKLKKLSFHSNLGGNCRIRVAEDLNPEKGVVLKPASGENPNPFYAVPRIKAPIISDKAKLNKVVLKETKLYDFETKAGKDYYFTVE